MPSTKQCSKCNTPFGCSADATGCWCEGLALSSATLQVLKEQFDNCLCPACLKEYEAAASKEKSV